MRIALGADVEVVLKFLLPDDLAATLALDPEPFSAYAFFARLKFVRFSLKPRQAELAFP